MNKYPEDDGRYRTELRDSMDLLDCMSMMRSQIDTFLARSGIDTDYAKSIDVDMRSSYLIDALCRDLNEVQTPEGDAGMTLDEEVGLLLVKPEIFPAEDRVAAFLKSKGFEVKLLDRVYPTHAEWMSTYGYMLNSHPDVINLYIVQRSLGFRPILFRHFDIEDYLAFLGERGETVTDIVDKDEAFDRRFCGDVCEDSGDTLRGGVSLPTMKQLGFDDMSGYASLFDPVDYFKDIGMVKNYRAYNGIHIPSDSAEKSRNIKMLVKSGEFDA